LATGDTVELTYFEPESTHGQVRERQARFRLRGVAEMTAAALDPFLTPELEGVTDQQSIANWNPPFPYDAARVRSRPPQDQDEAYWKQHRATPKAFVSLRAGRRLWGSRFGQSTSLRIPLAAGSTAAEVAGRLQFQGEEGGLQVLAVKRDSLAASAGTTPFDGLFLGMSCFLLVAAVLLVALLVRLSVERRAAEIGVLLGLGFRTRAVLALLGLEALVVAVGGSAVGVMAGLGYAWLMVLGLGTWWVAAVGSPFVTLHAGPISLAVGGAAGALVSLLAILWTLARLRKLPVPRLLAGQTDPPPAAGPVSRWNLLVTLGLFAGALALAGWARQLSGEARAGAFFAAGALVLLASLGSVARFLRARRGTLSLAAGHAPLVRLAARNGQRNAPRSTLTIGLVAAASFLIVAVSAFRLDPAALAAGRASGSGGFALVAQTDLPIYHDLSTPEGRRELSWPAELEPLAARAAIVSLRVQPGEDASCLNLYRPSQPRVLAVPRTLAARGGFAWAATAASTPEESQNPWLLLDRPLPAAPGGQAPVPAVLDANTATYSLKLSGVGAQFELRDGFGAPFTVQVVGLLKQSLLQGDVLLGETEFLRRFPQVSGARLLLVDAPAADAQPLARAMAEALSDYGAAVESSLARLAAFSAVQNTYLSTFQSLGGLGLLLGTLGLAAVQVRSVLERRGELALLRAAGFRRGQLARLVLIEHALLLLTGLGLGLVAAAVALLPHLAAGSPLPWGHLGLVLAGVLAAGLTAGLWAVRAALRAELLPALRGT
jgi:hypothetical protein